MNIVQQIVMALFNVLVMPFVLAVQALFKLDVVGILTAPYEGLRKVGLDYYDEAPLLLKIAYTGVFVFVFYYIGTMFLF